MNNIYITGDRHGNFDDIGEFCRRFDTSKDDIMIILGDVGINYYVKKYHDANNDTVRYYNTSKDVSSKQFLQSLPLQFFCIHGNHEARPESVLGYEIIDYHGGKAYIQKEYPDIVFAIDGQIYNFDDKRYLVIGGAYSVDKHYRLATGNMWWADEQPSDKIKRVVESTIKENPTKIDGVLSHTCPFKYIPREMFLSCVDQSTVDNSTELWLDTIEESLYYKRWYCGHYHTNKHIDSIHFLFGNIELLNDEW